MSVQLLKKHIDALNSMKKYPSTLYYEGNLELLNKPKVSIVGTRRPSAYTKAFTHQLANKIAQANVTVVSGAAMGVDALAHHGAGSSNTIAVMPCGADINYPAVNKQLIEDIRNNGLILSQFELGYKATPYSFVQRNETVVALGDMLIVTQADLNSGSMRSVEFAQALNKPIYVLPHRLGESEGTNGLLANNQAQAIYDIDTFVQAHFGLPKDQTQDSFVLFCKTNPTYEEAVGRFASKVFEAELSGEIAIKDGKVLYLH